MRFSRATTAEFGGFLFESDLGRTSDYHARIVARGSSPDRGTEVHGVHDFQLCRLFRRRAVTS
jgi:hypothetical protein